MYFNPLSSACQSFILFILQKESLKGSPAVETLPPGEANSPASCKHFPYRTRSTRSVSPLASSRSDETILYRGKASGWYLLNDGTISFGSFAGIHPSGFGLYPLDVNKTRRLKS